MRIDESRKVRFEGEERGEETLFILRAHPITNTGWILTTTVVLVLPIIGLGFLFFSKTINIPVDFPTMVLGVLIWFLVFLGVAYQQFINWYFNIDSI